MGIRSTFHYSMLAFAFLLPLSGCSIGETRFSYRITTEIYVNGHKFSGSAVRQVSLREMSGPMATAPYRARMHGEAVVIDMGRLGKAFTLLYRAEPDEGLTYGDGCTGDAVTNYIIARMKRNAGCSNAAEHIEHFKNSKIALEFYGETTPTTVKFTNFDHPESIDYLNKTFKIRYFISTSEADVTHRIFSDIPWLHRLFKKRLDGGVLVPAGSNPLSSIIGGEEFSTEPPSNQQP